MVRRLLLAFLLAAPSVPASRSAEPVPVPAAVAFARLRALQGAWSGTFEGGSAPHRIDYRMSAGDTVLVETWTLRPGRESMTLYHLDGESLLATHYCPQGNQPRLQLSAIETDGTLRFAFRDGSNLGKPDRSHQHAFWLRPVDAATFVRDETYVEDDADALAIAGAAPGTGVVYRRLPAPAATAASESRQTR